MISEIAVSTIAMKVSCESLLDELIKTKITEIANEQIQILKKENNSKQEPMLFADVSIIKNEEKVADLIDKGSEKVL